MEETYVKRHWESTIRLENNWLLSVGFGMLDKEDDNNFVYHEKDDFITKSQLSNVLMDMANIINALGIPQIGSWINFADSYDKIYDIDYNPKLGTITINFI